MRRVFCASSRYLSRHGTPRQPRDLLGHRLGWYSGYPTKERLVFHGAGADVALQIKPVLLTNSVHLLREYALEHAGIVCVPTLVASDEIVAGTLKVVLPKWRLDSFWLSIFYPTTLRSALKLKLFLETVTAAFSTEVPPWDAVLIEAGLVPVEISD